MHNYARSVCISNDLGNPSKIHVCPVGCRELDKPYERSLAPNDRLTYSNHSREWSHPRKDLSHVMKVHLDGIYRVHKKKVDPFKFKLPTNYCSKLTPRINECVKTQGLYSRDKIIQSNMFKLNNLQPAGLELSNNTIRN